MVDYAKIGASRARELFRLHRAEWLSDQIFDLFTRPSYFGELESHRPSVLEGGRGTGKTTVLKGLSWEAQRRWSDNSPDVSAWKYVGLYHRIDATRVTAFRGAELEEEQWIRVFSHYMNLLLAGSVCRFGAWLETSLDEPLELDLRSLNLAARSLGLASDVGSITEMLWHIDRSVATLESSLNAIADGSLPHLSLLGAPLEPLIRSLLHDDRIAGKLFFFALDEYETFDAYQQRTVNTLIKQGSELYAFKLGVREFGWTTRDTLIEGQPLTHPADYNHMSVQERLDGPSFSKFAEQVCIDRFRLAWAGEVGFPGLRSVFPGMSTDDEAAALGIAEIVGDLRAEWSSETGVAELSDVELFYLSQLAHESGIPLDEAISDATSNVSAWRKSRFVNYRTSTLYMIRSGKAGIRKYYCGWDTLVSMAAGNIRFLMELVEEALRLHDEAGGQFGEPISQHEQTVAAQIVGRKNLLELNGVSTDGGSMTRMLLSLGRVLGLMAQTVVGHTPEANQFVVRANSRNREAAEESLRLLQESVKHLMLVRTPATKLGAENDVREDEYRVHPIYAAYFNFSPARKRRFVLLDSDIVALASDPRAAIRHILARQNRDPDQHGAAEDMPDQLQLFEGFYLGA